MSQSVGNGLDFRTFFFSRVDFMALLGREFTFSVDVLSDERNCTLRLVILREHYEGVLVGLPLALSGGSCPVRKRHATSYKS